LCSFTVESRIDNGCHRIFVEQTAKKRVNVFRNASRVLYCQRVSNHETRDISIVEKAMNFLQLLVEDIGQATALEVGTFAPLEIKHRMLRCQYLIQISLHEDNAILRWPAIGFAWYLGKELGYNLHDFATRFADPTRVAPQLRRFVVFEVAFGVRCVRAALAVR
jgi:hypothetical protein